MKKFFLIIILTLSSFLSSSVFAYEQTAEICYSQCLAYKFVWRGNYCYDKFTQECVISAGDAAIKTVTILKNIVSSVISGQRKEILDVGLVFKAWLVCKPLIELCLVPVMNSCEWECRDDLYSYAPDFAVGNYREAPSISYDKNNKQLKFRVINVGDAYAWDIDVAAYYGWSTAMKGVNDEVEDFQTLFEEKIDHLIFAGARNGPPKNISDYVKDFLIEESRFSRWLQEYKSDAKDYNVPKEWVKVIPFEPKEQALNRIILKVNYNNVIPERDWNRNELVYDIDLRPNPPQTFIESLQTELHQIYLRKFEVHLLLKNYGDLTDYVTLQFREGEKEGEGGLFYVKEIVDPLHSLPNEKGQWFNYFIDVNADNVDYCGVNKKYRVEMTDSLGRKTIKTFFLPVYFPVISGRIVDLDGKAIKGATIRAHTGEEAISDENGFYHLRVKKLNYFTEKINLTISHPEYSQIQKRELEIKKINEFNPCEDLTFYQDFILKDVDVNFRVEVYDKKTNELLNNVYLVATNLEGFKVGSRVETIVDGATDLPQLQPGKFLFTLSKEGYKTIGQTVNAVPEEQTLKFYMEKLTGRESDEGLEIIKPQLLWTKDLKGENFVAIRMTKDGKTVIIYTSQNKPNTGKIYFLDSLSGEEKKIVSTIANSGISQASIDTSYDGNTTAFCSNDGKIFGQERGKNWIKIFDAEGNLIGEKEYASELSTDICEVSPDGFYLYPSAGLMNKGFYEYTRFDTEGLLDYDRPSQEKVGFSSYQGTHFLTNNNVVGPGEENCPVGIRSIFGNKFLGCLNEAESPVFVDSSVDASSIAVMGLEKLFWFKSGVSFKKEVETRSNFLTVGLTPGGDYLIYNTYVENLPYRIFKIFNKNKQDLTPLSQKETEDLARGEDVIYVAANDKGIFYASQKHHTLRFYQVGKYQKEYKPETETTQEEINASTNHNLFKIENGQYIPLGNIDFRTLPFGQLYFAKNDVNLNLGPLLKTLKITKDTYFSIKENNVLVLLKGQINVEAKTPFRIYAIKNDRFDLNVFQEKLDKFLNNSLPEDEYFLIQNIQTKFLVKNTLNKITVVVEKGEVELKGKNIQEKITVGNQLTIDKENRIKRSKYYGGKIYQILSLFILVAIIVLLFIFRKSKSVQLIFKFLKKFFHFLFQIMKSFLKRNK
ncbi:MAG: carboxypeptidase-like regulatory domain-containing protein [candidate division WOR-3 bacterium]